MILFAIFLTGMLYSLEGSAAEDSEKIFKEFQEAVKEKDNVKITKSVLKINDNLDAKRYLRDKQRTHYHLYKSYDLLRRRNRLENRSTDAAPEREYNDSIGKGKRDNQRKAKSSPNNKKKSNRETTKRFSLNDQYNRNRVSNSEAARRSPNQNRKPNKARR